jgi:glycosyltransferase involved in cell wall biosynthesis
VPRKNLLLLGRAAAAAREVGVPVELRIVGPVPDAGRAIAAEIEELLGPDARILGYVTDAELAAEYKAADVVCFPSLFEGFGMPIVEAMAAGVPVVVSDALASKEVTAGAAMVCGAHDVRAWRDGLVSLWTSPEVRARFRDDGLRRASSFSWHTSAQIVLDAMGQAAVSPRRQP